MSIVCLVRQNAILLSFDILKLQYLGFEILCFFPIWREPSLQSQLEKLRSIFHCPLNEITPSIHWSVFWVCSLPMVFDHCHFTNDLAKPFLQWTTMHYNGHRITMHCNGSLQSQTVDEEEKPPVGQNIGTASPSPTNIWSYHSALDIWDWSRCNAHNQNASSRLLRMVKNILDTTKGGDHCDMWL